MEAQRLQVLTEIHIFTAIWIFFVSWTSLLFSWRDWSYWQILNVMAFSITTPKPSELTSTHMQLPQLHIGIWSFFKFKTWDIQLIALFINVMFFPRFSKNTSSMRLRQNNNNSEFCLFIVMGRRMIRGYGSLKKMILYIHKMKEFE